MPDGVADTMDEVARDCSPKADVTENPAKDLALCLADAQPLVWGGSVLAARASRRVAEALRAATGRAALAADADELLPIIEATTSRDPFADPFTDGTAADRRPCLLLLDDGNNDPLVRADHGRLVAAAERADIRVSVVQHRRGHRRGPLRRPAADRHVRRGLPQRRPRAERRGLTAAGRRRPDRRRPQASSSPRLTTALRPRTPARSRSQRRGDRVELVADHLGRGGRPEAAAGEGGGQEVAEQRRSDRADRAGSRPRSPTRARRTAARPGGGPR